MSSSHALAPTPTTAPAASATYTGPATPVVLAAAVVAGAVLGVVDLWLLTHDPSAWSTVIDSCAGWAAGAFVLGAVLRVDALRAAVAAVVMLAVAVEVYYAAKAGDFTIVTTPVAMEWLVLGGVAGAVFGPAGAWAAGRSPVRAAVGLAAGVALLLGDAWQLAQRDLGGGNERVVLVLLALVMLASSLRRPGVAVAALVLSLPLSLVVATAFTSTGVYM